MGFDNSTQFGQWRDYDVRLLRTSSEIIGDALERKRSEEVLLESEERYRDLFENMLDGAVLHRLIVDEDGNPVDYILEKIHSAAEKILSLKRKDTEDKRATEIYSGDTPFIERYARVAQTGKAEYFIDYYPRFEKWYEIASFCPERGHFANFFRDITDRRRSEEALRTSEEKYRTILESIEEGYLELDLKGNFTFLNDSVAKKMGYTKNELIGMNNRDYTTPETARKMYQIFNEIYRTGRPARVTDYEIIKKDGNSLIAEMSASLIRD